MNFSHRRRVGVQQQVSQLVALDPDGPAILAAMQGVYETYRHEGLGPAMQKFLGVAGLNGGPQPSESVPQGETNPEMLEAIARMQRNIEFFLEHYLQPVTGYQPDIAALLTESTRVVAAVGEASRGQLAYRGGVELAERLGTEVQVFPGDHVGFVTHPDEFASMLHKVLAVG